MTTRQRAEDTVTDPAVKRLIQYARWAADYDRAADLAADEGDSEGEEVLRKMADKMWEKR